MADTGEGAKKRKRDDDKAMSENGDNSDNNGSSDKKKKPKKKKLKLPTLEELLERPWCYYCENDFVDLKVLHEHQKSKHFRCPEGGCPRRLATFGGLRVHLQQVHKQDITQVPNATDKTKDDIHTEVFAMVGIPQHIVDARTDSIVRAYHAKEMEHWKRTGNPLPGSTRKHEHKEKKVETKEEKLARINAAREARRLRVEAEKAGLPVDAIMSDAPSAAAAPVQGHTPPVSSDQAMAAPLLLGAPPNAFSPVANTPPFAPPVNAPGFPQQSPMMMSAPGMPPMPMPTTMASRPMPLPMPMSPAMQLPGFGPPPLGFSPAHQRPLPASFQPPAPYGFHQGPPPMAHSPIGQQGPPLGSYRPPNGHGLPPKPNVPFPAKIHHNGSSYGQSQRNQPAIAPQASNPDVDDMINQIATTGQYNAGAIPPIKAEPLDTTNAVEAKPVHAAEPTEASKPVEAEPAAVPTATESSAISGAPKASDTKKSKSKSNKDEQQLLSDNIVSWEEKRARNPRYQVRRDIVVS